MKITTWNINSVRLRIELINKLNIEYSPDIICLQETKTEDKYFPIAQIKNIGFEHIAFSGQKSYNGVAILSKLPIQDSFSIELYNQDKRHICAKINQFEIHNFYVPAGGDEPDITINPKYKHKLEYIELMQKWLASNRSPSDQLILVGDLNIAPHEHDVWSSKQLHNVISHTQAERESLLNLQKSFDFIDTGRHFIDMQKKLYSWWSYRNCDWKKSNRGRRLDHIWVTRSLEKQLNSIDILSNARDWLKPSDHVPCILDITSTN
jgi:exodeoxyribonuclease III